MISEIKKDILSILVNRFTIYVYLLMSTRVVGHEFQHDGENNISDQEAADAQEAIEYLEVGDDISDDEVNDKVIAHLIQKGYSREEAEKIANNVTEDINCYEFQIKIWENLQKTFGVQDEYSDNLSAIGNASRRLFISQLAQIKLLGQEHKGLQPIPLFDANYYYNHLKNSNLNYDKETAYFYNQVEYYIGWMDFFKKNKNNKAYSIVNNFYQDTFIFESVTKGFGNYQGFYNNKNHKDEILNFYAIQYNYIHEELNKNPNLEILITQNGHAAESIFTIDAIDANTNNNKYPSLYKSLGTYLTTKENNESIRSGNGQIKDSEIDIAISRIICTNDSNGVYSTRYGHGIIQTTADKYKESKFWFYRLISNQFPGKTDPFVGADYDFKQQFLNKGLDPEIMNMISDVTSNSSQAKRSGINIGSDTVEQCKILINDTLKNSDFIKSIAKKFGKNSDFIKSIAKKFGTTAAENISKLISTVADNLDNIFKFLDVLGLGIDLMQILKFFNTPKDERSDQLK